MTDRKSQHLELLQQFNNDVVDLLRPTNESGTSLIRAIQQRANKSHLKHLDAKEVLIEAVKRGMEFIEKTGKPIKNPRAWLMSTSFYILSNEVRLAIQTEKLINQVGERRVEQSRVRLSIYAPQETDPVIILERSERMDVLYRALRSLSKEDQEILRLHVFEERDYEEIQQYYLQNQGECISEPTLRQRVSRAKTRLKRKFLLMYEEEPPSF